MASGWLPTIMASAGSACPHLRELSASVGVDSALGGVGGGGQAAQRRPLLVGVDGEVAACGGQGLVTHEALDDATVGACTQEAGGEEVPELVGGGGRVGAVECL